MSRRWLAAGFLMTGLVFACGGGEGGGGSGVTGTKKVVDMSPAELDQFCTFVAATFPSRTVTCSGEMVMFGSTKDACISKAPKTTTTPSCTATVSQAEACFNAFGDLTDAQVCTLVGGGPAPAACAPLDSAACSTSSGVSSGT